MRILAYRGKSFISRLIRFQTRSKYSHIGIELSDGRVIEAWHRGGVSISPSFRTLHTPGTLVDVYKVMGEYDEPAIEKWLLGEVGKAYDFVSILRFISRREGRDEDNGKWFCSELCAAGFKRGGVILQTILDSFLTPRDIAMSPVIKFIMVIKC